MSDIETLRTRLLVNIDDLREKIKNNEDFPESKQNESDLIEFIDRIDECLSCWYY